MDTRYKPTEQKEEADAFDVGFTLPDTTSILQRLEVAEKEELRREHKEEMEMDEKNGQATKKRQRQGGTVCCCEDPNCRIGPFIEKQ
jgi:hypothetical protein